MHAELLMQYRTYEKADYNYT